MANTINATPPPVIIPAAMSLRKCCTKYILEQATKTANNRHNNLPDARGIKKAKREKNANAEVVCPEGKLVVHP
jgi:hypothetical protein